MHIFDDFVLQPICLSKLKCKSWWESQPGYSKNYENDYIVGLYIHAISWSISIHLPMLIFMVLKDMNLDPGLLFVLGLVIPLLQAVVHTVIDDLKANHKSGLNLVEDQLMHFIQIILSFTAFLIICG